MINDFNIIVQIYYFNIILINYILINNSVLY